MNKIDINKFQNIGYLESSNICTIYGQEVLDKFLDLLINKIKKEGFKHYELDFINSNLKGKYYRIVNNYLEMMISENNINNDALDLQYLFSKLLKDILGISLIEGSRKSHNYIYYYGYILINKLKTIYVIRQNKTNAYLKFNLLNIFYSVYEDDSYLSYKILPSLYIIPLHQNKSGVLSYASKVQNQININSYIDDRNISPLEKKKETSNKRIPIIIYVGPKEYKNRLLTIEYNNIKTQFKFDEIEIINNLLIKSLNDKYNSFLKKIYCFDKEKFEIDNLEKIIKINICNDCVIEGYNYFLTPFNRVSKINRCIVCNKELNNIVLLKKK